jgi:outer membrane protein assembly factor BamB
MAESAGTPGRAAPQMRYALSQMRSKNGHHEFEHLCREVTRLRITPNVLPATGPVSAGGDQGRDFETFRSYLGEWLPGSFLAREADSRIVFACTLQRDHLDAKIKGDLRKITGGGPVDQVYFFCESDMPVAKRHELCKWARSDLGVEIEIIDGQALSELLAADDCRWIAERYLGIEIPAGRLSGLSEQAQGSFSGFGGTGVHVGAIQGNVNIYQAGAPVAPDAGGRRRRRPASSERPRRRWPRTTADRVGVEADSGPQSMMSRMLRRPRVIVIAAVIVISGVLAAASAVGDETPPSRGIRASGWTYTTRKSVSSSPVVSGGTVYIGSSDHKVYALNAVTGHVIWAKATGGAVGSSPVIANGMVYAGSNDGYVYARDTATGHLLWRTALGDWITSTPAVSGGKVYVGSGDRRVYALDALTGAIVWSHLTGGSVESSPAVSDGTVYVGSDDGKVYALDAATGHVRWIRRTGGQVQSSPAVANGTVYIGSNDHRVYALTTGNGHVKWHYSTGGPIGYSTPQVAAGTVYIGSGDDSLYAIYARAGRLHWAFPTRNPIVCRPAVADGIVYAGSKDDNVYAVNATTGKLLRVYPTGDSVESSPVVAGGKVYFGSNDHKIYALDATTKP